MSTTSTTSATFDTVNKTVTLDLAIYVNLVSSYVNLVSSQSFLNELKGGGVDNWDYYDDSAKMYRDKFKKFRRDIAAKTGLTVDDIDDMLD